MIRFLVCTISSFIHSIQSPVQRKIHFTSRLVYCARLQLHATKRFSVIKPPELLLKIFSHFSHLCQSLLIFIFSMTVMQQEVLIIFLVQKCRFRGITMLREIRAHVTDRLSLRLSIFIQIYRRSVYFWADCVILKHAEYIVEYC